MQPGFLDHAARFAKLRDQHLLRLMHREQRGSRGENRCGQNAQQNNGAVHRGTPGRFCIMGAAAAPGGSGAGRA